MGADCSSCGCTDQSEFKTNEVMLDDGMNKKNQQYGMGFNNSAIANNKQQQSRYKVSTHII